RALMYDEPQLFFYLLRECGALACLFPELDALFGVIQPIRYHPEIDSGIHTLLVLKQSAVLQAPLSVRFAALCHDYGKAQTPVAKRPAHHGHEQAGVPLAEACSRRLKVPKQIRQQAMLATRWHTHIHRFAQLRPQTILRLFEAMDAFRRPQRLEHLLQVCEADVRGRLGFEQRAYAQPDWARAALQAAAAVDSRSLAAASGRHGVHIANAIRQARLNAISKARQRLYS